MYFESAGGPRRGIKEKKNNKYFTDARAFWPSPMAVKLWQLSLNVSRLLAARSPRFSLSIAFCGAFTTWCLHYGICSALAASLSFRVCVSVCFFLRVCMCVCGAQLFLVRSVLCCNVTAFPRIELLESCGSDRRIGACCLPQHRSWRRMWLRLQLRCGRALLLL